jgi:hypothetical protein
MKRELVRAERDSKNCPVVFIGDVVVRRWPRGTLIQPAENLTAAIQKELDVEFAVRARWASKESRYREVKHY